MPDLQTPQLRTRTSLVVVVLAALAAAAPPWAAGPAADPATPATNVGETPGRAGDPVAAIADADGRFNRAARERDRDAFRASLAQDAVFFAGELHRGRLEVMTIWQHLFDGKYDFRYDAETLHTTAARSGDFGWTFGRVKTSFTRPGLDTEEVIDGHYLNLWRRSGDGWELAYSSALVVHPSLGSARDPRSGLMTAWPELADQVDAEVEIRWRPETTVRAASGELAYSFGTYEASFTPPVMMRTPAPEGAEPAPDAVEITGSGHYLALWQKDDQGRWQLAGEGFTPPGIY